MSTFIFLLLYYFGTFINKKIYIIIYFPQAYYLH